MQSCSTSVCSLTCVWLSSRYSADHTGPRKSSECYLHSYREFYHQQKFLWTINHAHWLNNLLRKRRNWNLGVGLGAIWSWIWSVYITLPFNCFYLTRISWQRWNDFSYRKHDIWTLRLQQKDSWIIFGVFWVDMWTIKTCITGHVIFAVSPLAHTLLS